MSFRHLDTGTNDGLHVNEGLIECSLRKKGKWTHAYLPKGTMEKYGMENGCNYFRYLIIFTFLPQLMRLVVIVLHNTGHTYNLKCVTGGVHFVSKRQGWFMSEENDKERIANIKQEESVVDKQVAADADHHQDFAQEKGKQRERERKRTTSAVSQGILSFPQLDSCAKLLGNAS